MGKNKIGRNDLCTCESGLKYKKCHGDHVKIMQSKQAYHDRFNGLIEAEKAKAKKLEAEASSKSNEFNDGLPKI